MKRPVSRDSYTLFPAGISPKNSTHSSITSERMGAFGTLQLDEEPRAHTPTNLRPHHAHQRSHSQPPFSSGYSPVQQNTPIMPVAGYAPVPRRENYTGEPVRPNAFGMESHPYQPTTVSNADTTETRRKYDKLSEVYSMSDDTVEFAKNFSDYLNEKIPYGFTIGALSIMCLVAFVLTLVGALNIPFCPVQPMIPIWLMVSGILFIVSASFRIIRHIPDPTPRRQVRRSEKKKRLSTSLCVTAFELLFLFINLIWLILGCVWVYGSRYYVHFRDQLFEEHFCDSSLYYTAFAAVTAYLVFVCVLILALICILFVGSVKEANAQDLD